MDLYNGWRWFWTLVVVTYLVTLALEWPFVALCFRGSPDWFKRSLKGNLLVQTASYLVLFGWYWSASGTSLYTKMNVVAPEEMPLPDSVLVYYISDKEGDVVVRPLASKQAQTVFNLKSSNKDDRLFVRKEALGSNCWDLAALLTEDGRVDPKTVEIQKCFARQAALDEKASPEHPEQGTWSNFGDVPRLGDTQTNRWEFYSGFWAVEGLRGSNRQKGTSVGFSVETPFLAWTVRNATQLPTDQVIFQLGDNQICIFDPESKKVALLARGRGPVVVLAEKNGQR